MSWHLETEYAALVLLFILGFYSRERFRAPVPRTHLYHAELYVSALATALNISSITLLAHGGLIPYALSLAVNTAYFFFIVMACSLMAAYLLLLLFEYRERRTALSGALGAVAALYALYVAALVANLFTGCIFRIDEGGGYVRGPLVNLGYGVLILDTLLVGVVYLRNRSSAMPHVARVIKTLPFFVLLVFFLQVKSPSMPLGGLLTAVVNLILFINFQNQKLSQDALTQLGNRAAFFAELAALLRRGESAHVVLLSLKHFEQVNRAFSHRCGDAFLCLVARYLDGVSQQGRAYRYGNVEFALIREDAGGEEACRFMQSLRRRFSQDWRIDRIRCLLPACFADIRGLREGEDENRVSEYLEYALELAKYAPDADWVSFDEATRRSMARRAHVLSSLQSAVQDERDRFGVCYQPIRECKTGDFGTLEALLRLRDGDGTPIPPDEFIPLAEETGLIGELTWILLDEVCTFLSGHAALPVKSVSINLSAQQFLDAELIDRLDGVLRAKDVPASKLKIEVTERVIAENLQTACAAMRRLTGLGLAFYLDDFGTGYSNFSSALALPFECIKLDRSLVSPLGESEKSRLLVRSVVEAFHAMGMSLVAEGVETQEQAQVLRDLGVDRIQGYLYARPMFAEELLRFYEG